MPFWTLNRKPPVSSCSGRAGISWLRPGRFQGSHGGAHVFPAQYVRDNALDGGNLLLAGVLVGQRVQGLEFFAGPLVKGVLGFFDAPHGCRSVLRRMRAIPEEPGFPRMDVVHIPARGALRCGGRCPCRSDGFLPLGWGPPPALAFSSSAAAVRRLANLALALWVRQPPGPRPGVPAWGRQIRIILSSIRTGNIAGILPGRCGIINRGLAERGQGRRRLDQLPQLPRGAAVVEPVRHITLERQARQLDNLDGSGDAK